MAKRREERVGSLERWQRAALLGLGEDGLTDDERFEMLLSGDVASLAPVWARHRARLLPDWVELRGGAVHPMDDPHRPRLPEPRRARRR